MKYKAVSNNNPENDRLVLVLRKKWFDMWNQEIKTEDYRELTEKWLSILFGVSLKNNLGQRANKREVYRWLVENKDSFLKENKVRDYSYIELCHAYSSNRPICKAKFLGVEIRKGNEEWGAKEGEIYFCIKGGPIYERKNI